VYNPATLLAIETRQLEKRFRKLHGYRDLALYPWRRPEILALRGVDLAVNSGELYGILGPNGAGKSTLIRILCTTLLPSAGMAAVGGLDVVRQPHAVRRMIGLVQSEERSFYWRLTARQNLEFFAALFHVPSNVARRRVQDLVRRLGLEEAADRPFQALSTGTRQKFAIIRGLMTNPAVLFLDEPTRSLDLISAAAVRRFVKDRIVGEFGTTVLLATHSLHEAEELCVRLALLRDGQIAAEGTPEELRRALRSGLSCEMSLRSMPTQLPERIRDIAGVIEVTKLAEGAEVRLRVDCERRDGIVDAIIGAVIDSGAQFVDFTTREPSLEEAYVRAIAPGQLAPVPQGGST
jgi:ABC-2 type transport system ATP-binding protein